MNPQKMYRSPLFRVDPVLAWPASEDEDEEGQGVIAQLFEEGVSEAAHDQMLQAAIAARERRLADA